MSRFSPGRFAAEAGAISALSALALVFALGGAAGDRFAWAARGFLAMALPVIGAGWWLAREHGRAGGAFVIALGAGFILRAALLAVVVATAARRGPDALVGALAGLAAGFVPLTAFEMLWFTRRAHRASAEATGGA